VTGAGSREEEEELPAAVLPVTCPDEVPVDVSTVVVWTVTGEVVWTPSLPVPVLIETDLPELVMTVVYVVALELEAPSATDDWE
jgi:hypothetical protein